MITTSSAGTFVIGWVSGVEGGRRRTEVRPVTGTQPRLLFLQPWTSARLGPSPVPPLPSLTQHVVSPASSLTSSVQTPNSDIFSTCPSDFPQTSQAGPAFPLS